MEARKLPACRHQHPGQRQAGAGCGAQAWQAWEPHTPRGHSSHQVSGVRETGSAALRTASSSAGTEKDIGGAAGPDQTPTSLGRPARQLWSSFSVSLPPPAPHCCRASRNHVSGGPGRPRGCTHV